MINSLNAGKKNRSSSTINLLLPPHIVNRQLSPRQTDLQSRPGVGIWPMKLLSQTSIRPQASLYRIGKDTFDLREAKNCLSTCSSYYNKRYRCRNDVPFVACYPLIMRIPDRTRTTNVVFPTICAITLQQRLEPCSGKDVVKLW